MIISDGEGRLKQMSPNAKKVVIPAGVDTSFFRSIGLLEEPRSIISMGSMEWRLNADAVLWICYEVLPIVLRKSSSARVCVVGKGYPCPFSPGPPTAS